MHTHPDIAHIFNVRAEEEAPAYAGIGSRETPADILDLMREIAHALCRKGFVLRSGGAGGADTAFAEGASADMTQIFVPWRGFSNIWPATPRGQAPDYRRARGPILVPEGTAAHALGSLIAEKYHPAWDRLTRGPRALMIRNTFQVLGANPADPVQFSRFIIAWTKDGGATGGTGQAIRIALDHKIPVFNLQRPADRALVCRALAL